MVDTDGMRERERENREHTVWRFIEWKSARDHEIDTDVRSFARLLPDSNSFGSSLAGLLFYFHFLRQFQSLNKKNMNMNAIFSSWLLDIRDCAVNGFQLIGHQAVSELWKQINSTITADYIA